MVQRADASEAQDRRDLCVFILVENELKSVYMPPIGPQKLVEIILLWSTKVGRDHPFMVCH